MTTLPSKFFSPARRIASSVPAPSVARTMTSPNRAASSNVPADARGAEAEAHPFSFSGSRDPILAS
jgi:hypothetical protein